jgi:PPK2 family polyphosphate:nucleotide phosphotransferase
LARISRKRITEFIEPFRVKPGQRVRLPRDFDPAAGKNRPRAAQAKALLDKGIELLSDYQAKLAAQDSYGLLVVLQAMDAAGKDGTIRHVMSGVNPQGVSVHSFKIPSSEDLDHDFLWRYQKVAPERGSISIFNRSHYEEVLVVRVHPEFLQKQKLPASARRGNDIWQRRYRSINDWEHHLVENGIIVVKLFLNVSNGEQKARFLSRIDEPDKNWKFSANDARERTFWNDYQKAFAEMLSATSTEHAPWYVIPADDKPFARVAAAAVIANALIEIDPRYPTVSKEQKEVLQTIRVELDGGTPASAKSADGDDADAPADGHRRRRRKGHRR